MSHGRPEYAFLLLVVASIAMSSPTFADPPIIAIVDSGLDATLGTFSGRIVPGYDFVSDDPSPDDSLGHGTEIAGIAAGGGSPAGACPTCRIMAFRVAGPAVYGAGGVVYPGLVKMGILQAIENGADVILVSAGFAASDTGIAGAIELAEAEGIAVVAPAGSYGRLSALYPAALPTVVSVAAADDSARFSRYASFSGFETVAAPSENLPTVSVGGGLVTRSGSSAAAARIAGVIGQLLITQPALTPPQLRQIIRHGVQPLAIPFWYDDFDLGVHDLSAALARSSPAYADVAITRMRIAPASPQPGQANVVRIRVHNQGNVATPGPLALNANWDGSPQPAANVPPLAAGQAYEMTIELPTVGSPTTVSLDATVAAAPGEIETPDNSRSTSITYTSSPVHDVEVSLGNVSDGSLESGQITIPVTVRNRGNQDEPAVTVEVRVDQSTTLNYMLNLPATAETTFTAVWAILPSGPPEHRFISAVATIPDADANDDDNSWGVEHSIASREGTGALQYADRAGVDIVMDAPWKTIRDYLPVLFYFPDFKSTGATTELVSLNISPYNVTTGEPAPAIFLDLPGQPGTLTNGFTIINPDGAERADLTAGETIGPHWHYIVRVPRAMLQPAGAGPVQYLQTQVRWKRIYMSMKHGTDEFRNIRVMRVLFDETRFPKYDALDRYFDAHVHTIAEQTTMPVYDLPHAARKNYGGPLAMLIECSYALGLVNTPFANGNWAAYKDSLVITDHNVFYSNNPYDQPPTAPGYGPTSGTNGHAGERDWYRTNLGKLAGEEIALASGSNQVLGGNPQKLLGHHFLAYDTKHYEGPWHGGGFGFSVTKIVRGQAITVERLGVQNPNRFVVVLNEMKGANTTGFGYAAHPDAAPQVWPDEYFELGYGFSPYNSEMGAAVNSTKDDFHFKGSQVWNQKPALQAAANGQLSVEDLDRMNPFPGGPGVQRLTPTPWDRELLESFGRYLKQVSSGLLLEFTERPKERFIRKIYMTAGTDAHGDFNYTDDVLATVATLAGQVPGLGGNVSISDNAYARVRTLALVSDRPATAQNSHDAYRDGNTVLTDGPLVKLGVDSDGRHNPGGGVGRWHDATNQWENAEGRIGGLGKYDGGRSVLVPRPGDDAFFETVWKKSATPGAGSITKLKIDRQTRALRDSFDLTPGGDGELKRQRTPKSLDTLCAVVVTARDLSIDERAITNPVWVVPVEIEIQRPAICPFPAGTVKAIFRFPISMKDQANGKVFIRPLDANGNSTDPEYAMNPAPGWEEENATKNGRYTCVNAAQIECPPENWDATSHATRDRHKSWVAYMVAPTDIHDNPLNDIGKTFVQAGGAPGGGPGGGGCPFVDVRTARGWEVENSILGRSATGRMATDYCPLRTTPALVDGRHELRIREDEAELTTIDEVGLLAVDHEPGLEVVLIDGRPMLGRPLPAPRVTMANGTDVTELLAARDGRCFDGRPGDVLEIESPTHQGPVLFRRAPMHKHGAAETGRTDGGRTPAELDHEVLNTTGIRIEVPGPDSGWTEIEHLYPREHLSSFDLMRSGGQRWRMVFVGAHRLDDISALAPVDLEPTATRLPLLKGLHSRRGDVSGLLTGLDGRTTTLHPGERIDLAFEALPIAGDLVREFFLVSHGVYTAAPDDAPARIAGHFNLAQNQPNPFPTTTTIAFALPEAGSVRLEIFDLLGRQVRTLAEGRHSAGPHAVEWDRRDDAGAYVPPGVYWYRLTAGDFRDQKKMVLLP